jgi:HSP20 family protein
MDELFDRNPGRVRDMPTGDEGASELQSVPVNVFETPREMVLVAAMPGMEASNIHIQVQDNYLTIRGNKRGPGQERHRYLRREWSYGPYERTIELPPVNVDVDRANATYDNGIVTVALPKAAASRSQRVNIQLVQIGGTRGEHVGHRGSAGPSTATTGAGRRGRT